MGSHTHPIRILFQVQHFSDAMDLARERRDEKRLNESKVQIGLAKGKNLQDKRETIKRRDQGGAASAEGLRLGGLRR